MERFEVKRRRNSSQPRLARLNVWNIKTLIHIRKNRFKYSDDELREGPRVGRFV